MGLVFSLDKFGTVGDTRCVATRPAIDLELVPLLRALETRIRALSGVTMAMDNGVRVYVRDELPFLQLEIRRDHMNLDLWLSEEVREDARASGLGRAHPFLGQETVKIRFERAVDLTKVARWLEASHNYVTHRAKREAQGASKSTGPKKAAVKSPGQDSKKVTADAVRARTPETPPIPAHNKKAAHRASTGREAGSQAARS